MPKKKNIINQKEAKRFNPSIKHGLTDDQVFNRMEQGLNNVVTLGSNKTILSIIINNIFTFFNMMFLVIFLLLLSAKVPASNYTFVFIVIFNTCIGIYQEIKSKRIIDKLSLQSAPNAVVIRNGEKKEVKISEIVLDDVIYLTPGKAIPTDAILQEGEIEVNESQLTGESIPIRKTIGDTLYSGSFVVSGNCSAIVERVGKENSMEKISSAARKYNKPKSEIMRSLNYLLRFVSIIIVPAAIILYFKSEGVNWAGNFFDKVQAFIKSFFVHSDTYQDTILSMSGSLIGMIPSGLILLTTIALAVGVRRLASNNTLIQEIYCIEMLAHVDVLCLDKTGTITDGTMTVTRFIEARRSEYNVPDIVSSMNSALHETNSTAQALEHYFGFGKKYHPVSVLPFTSDNKYSAVTFDKYGTFVLGAPEFVMKAGFEKIEEQVNEYANQGLRVLALAHSTIPLKNGKLQRTPKLVALILIEDQIRQEAFETIKFFKENNVQVKVISGDNPVTVSEVAKRVGIENAEDYISLEGLTDEEVATVANAYTVFGRVKPNQKKILVQALKAEKHKVAMTGDGVNDILALKEADCSIAMASGCDAVKNVAQVVLLDSNFASMPKVVGEGRRVINNIQQTASLFLVKTLFTMLVTMFVIFGVIEKFSPDGIGRYPLGPAQLMLIELFAIGIPSFILALQPNRNIVNGHFLWNVIRKSLPGAITIAVQVFITYLVSVKLGFSMEDIKTIISLTATTTCLLILYMACRPFNKWKAGMFVFLVSCCVVLFSLSLLDVDITIKLFKKVIELDFRTLFEYYPLYKNMGTYFDCNPLLLAASLAAISYVIIIIINYVISFLEEFIETRRTMRKLREKEEDEFKF